MPVMALRGGAIVRATLVSAAALYLAAAHADGPPAGGSSGWDVGAHYWISTGTSVRSHNAQPAVPELGNPTSVLTYGNLDANVLELHAAKSFPSRWFVQSRLGAGRIHTGWFDDEDYLAGQFKFSDTLSSVKGAGLRYLSFDIGREMAGERSRGWGLFAGVQQWTERADAYGLSSTVNFLGTPDLGNTVPAVSNEVTWRTLRLGFTSRARLDSRTRILFEAVLVPYGAVRDEDSHHLRTSPDDLGPVPNIVMEGRGRGLQLDLALRQALGRGYELGLGLRHWHLRATKGSRHAAGTVLPLVELQSERTGVTASFTKRW